MPDLQPDFDDMPCGAMGLTMNDIAVASGLRGLLSKLAPSLSRDISRWLLNRKWEPADGGVYLPEAKALMIGEVEARMGDQVQVARNSWTIEGFTHMLATEIGGGTQVMTWYLAPFSGNVAVSETATAATFSSTYTELTSQYSEATRVAYDEGVASSAQIDNYTSPAVVTAASSNVTISGFGALSVATKGSTSGTLLALHKYSTAWVIPESGGTIGLKYRFRLTNDPGTK